MLRSTYQLRADINGRSLQQHFHALGVSLFRRFDEWRRSVLTKQVIVLALRGLCQKETYFGLVNVSTSFDENAKSIGMILVGGPVRSGALELEIFCMSERFADEQA